MKNTIGHKEKKMTKLISTEQKSKEVVSFINLKDNNTFNLSLEKTIYEDENALRYLILSQEEFAFLSVEDETILEVACNYQEFDELKIDDEIVDATTLFVYVF
jgi:hypothetical protein